MNRRPLRGALLVAVVLVSGCASTVPGIAALPGAEPPGQTGTTGPAVGSPVAPGQPVTTAGDVPTPGGPAPGGQTGGAQTGGQVDPTAAGQSVQSDLSWLKPGARASYEFGAVSSAADRSTWKEDPAGQLYDPKTGKRYSSDRGIAPASQAAQGVTNYNVVAAEDTGVVLVREYILYDASTQTWIPTTTDIKGASNGKRGEVWIHPQVLAQLQGTGNDQDQVMVGPWDFNGQQVQCQIFLNNDINNYYFYAYDLATGLLLRADTSVVYEGSPSPSDPNSTNTRNSMEFKGLRQRGVPLGAPLPAWAAQGATVSYAGQYSLMDPTTNQPMQPGTPFTDQITVTPGGATWGNYQRSRQFSQGAEAGQGAVTSASGYAMDPTALAGMQQGAVLDEDPITGQKWTVQTAADGKVVIAVEMAGYQFLGEYEVSTGRLLQSQLATSLNFIQTQLQG